MFALKTNDARALKLTVCAILVFGLIIHGSICMYMHKIENIFSCRHLRRSGYRKELSANIEVIKNDADSLLLNTSSWIKVHREKLIDTWNYICRESVSSSTWSSDQNIYANNIKERFTYLYQNLHQLDKAGDSKTAIPEKLRNDFQKSTRKNLSSRPTIENASSLLNTLRKKVHAVNVLDTWNYVRSSSVRKTMRKNSQLTNTNNITKCFADLYQGLHNRDDKMSVESKKEILNKLGNYVQNQLHNLQNPKSCEVGRMVICQGNTRCGFGCYLHGISKCLLKAMTINKTAVFITPNPEYNLAKREDVFQQFSSCDYKPKLRKKASTIKKMNTASHNWTIENEDVPHNLLPGLLQAEVDPWAWWIGQFVQYCIRYQDDIQQLVKSYANSLPSPRIGVQVRRTDKIKESTYVSLKDYAPYLRFTANQIIQSSNSSVVNIYLMTDDINVVHEFKSIFPEYNVIVNETAVLSADVSLRHSPQSLRNVLSELEALVSSTYVICSHISNLCRLAAELFHKGNPGSIYRFHSVMSDYHMFNGQVPYYVKAVLSHIPLGKSEMQLTPGDIIRVEVGIRGEEMGDQRNGYCKGQKLNQESVLLYPCFKAKRIYGIGEF